MRQTQFESLPLQRLVAGELALQELRLRQDDGQRLLHVVADRGQTLLLLGHGCCSLASQRPDTLLLRLLAIGDVARDGVQQALGRGHRRPREPPVQPILTAKAILEPKCRLASRQLLQGRVCGGSIGRMHKAEQRLIEQVGLGVPECVRKHRAKPLKGPVAADDGEQVGRERDERCAVFRAGRALVRVDCRVGCASVPCGGTMAVGARAGHRRYFIHGQARASERNLQLAMRCRRAIRIGHWSLNSRRRAFGPRRRSP
jgi:hypothetical protein